MFFDDDVQMFSMLGKDSLEIDIPELYSGTEPKRDG